MLVDLKDFDYSAKTNMDLIIKERLRRLACSRMDGNAVSFGSDIFSKDADRFDISYNIFDKCSNIGYGCCDVYGPFDFYCLDMYEFANHVLESEELFAYLNLVRDGLEDHYSDDDLMELVLYKYEDSDPKVKKMLSLVREFDMAYRHAIKGEVKKALSYDVFSAFISDYMDYFAPRVHGLTPAIVAQNIELITAPFIDGSENHVMRCGCYASNEVRLYERYRKFLPRKQRKKVDSYIRTFKHPQSENCTVTENDECTCVFYIADQFDGVNVGMEEEGFNILFERAILWLDENLPKLRKKYYKVQDKSCRNDKKAAA